MRIGLTFGLKYEYPPGRLACPILFPGSGSEA